MACNRLLSLVEKTETEKAIEYRLNNYYVPAEGTALNVATNTIVTYRATNAKKREAIAARKKAFGR
jgi:hypothetical protein